MIESTPLDPGTLSPAAQRALGPGPGKMMAARGLVPLPPRDQVAVLYQLSLDADAGLAGAARTTAAGLPEKLLAGTLADQTLDARVLDFFGQLCADHAAVFDAVALNPTTDDTTITALAGRADSRGVDLLSQNEQRLLRHPEIIAAMYMNRRARMSTIDRVVELAVRNDVRVPGLAAWDEVARALTGEPPGPTDDALFDAVLGVRDDAELTTGDADQVIPEEELAKAEAARTPRMLELVIARPPAPSVRVPLKRTRALIGSAQGSDGRVPGAPAQWLLVQLDDSGDVTLGVVATRQTFQLSPNQSVMVEGAKITLSYIPFRDLPIPAKIRAATLGDAFVRAEAVRDPVRLVAMAAIKSPAVTEIEAARYAGNQVLPEDVVRFIAQKREWTKLYGVKVSLCRNPKTPIADTTRLLPFLRDRDLTQIMRSKGVPSAVVAQARKLHMTRTGKR